MATIFSGDLRGTISSGAGNDTYDPGPDQDTIQIEPGGDFDTVVGFQPGDDTLVFGGFRGIKSFDDLKPFMTTSGGDTVIDVTGANGTQAKIGLTLTTAQSVTVKGVETLGENDFAYAEGFSPLEPSPIFDPLFDRREGRPPPSEKLPELTLDPLPDPFPHDPGPDSGPPTDWLFG